MSEPGFIQAWPFQQNQIWPDGPFKSQNRDSHFRGDDGGERGGGEGGGGGYQMFCV